VTDASSARAGSQRSGRLAAQLREQGLDALLVTTPLDVRYLTGFTGTAGLALIAADASDPEGAGGASEARHRFFTDFRYETQAAEQVPASFLRVIVAGSLLEAAAGSLPDAGGRLGFDEATLTVSDHTKLGELLGAAWELVGSAGMVEGLRTVKDSGELSRMRAAAQLADEALRGVLEDGVVHRTERDVALELELRMRRLGADGPSFGSIVAAGPHAALPHAEPRAQEIPPDVLLTIDWGAMHEGYCSDCTRTYATGEAISDEAREVYALVLSAQEQALAAVRAGLSGRELDAVARDVIERAGHGEHFGHGLGHGVGLDIHEPPRLSRTAGEAPLQAGNVVTVEPGVYLPGRLGVRIEDMVLVCEGGHEVLSGLPKALTVIG
jgi:Xaa-Pro aminopeptidase